MKNIIPYKLFEEDAYHKDISIKVNEDHYQAEIPFDKGDTEGVVDDKPEHVQVIDAFEEFAKKTKFHGIFKSDGTLNSYLTDEVKEKAVERMFGSGEDDNDMYNYYYAFVQQYPISDNTQFYNRKFFKDNDEKFNDEGFAHFDYDTDLSDLLSKKGQKEFDKFKVDTAMDLEDENGFISSFGDVTDEGLKIYRAIDLKVVDNNSKNLFDQIVKNYSGAGMYWTYDENKPESYSSDYKGTTYVLHGVVRLQDINWENTYRKNIYSLREECEIEVNGDAIIKIEKIYNDDESKFLPLEEPIYVPT
jgi:hypothetical protein